MAMMNKKVGIVPFAGIAIASVLLFILLLRLLPVNFAAYLNLPIVVETQAFLGADLNSPWFFDETPLMIASTKSKHQIFEFLIQSGADINSRTSHFSGETVLLRSIRNGCELCVNRLIEKNVDINQRDSAGRSAIFFATMSDEERLVARLIDAGADPEIASVDGSTPLMVATTYRLTPIIKILLHHGASADKMGPRGSSIEIAERNGDGEILSLLSQNRRANDHGK